LAALLGNDPTKEEGGFGFFRKESREMLRREFLAGAAAALGLAEVPARADENLTDKFTQSEIVKTSSDFFGITTEATAKAVERVFRDLGEPCAYIQGNEGSAALVVGLRYGTGWLMRKGAEAKQIYWRGPSVGVDAGANASKVFTLVYNMKSVRQLYRRFPGVEGSYYFVAGIGVLYMRKNGVTVAPMRTGVGLRAGVNAQYQEFTPDRNWFPL
jgi:hypothetical protein